MASNHAKQIAFWKKHQTLLQNCADLSNRSGVKVLVRRLRFFLPCLNRADFRLLQCIISVPDKLSEGCAFQQTLTMSGEDGDIQVKCTAGTTVIFDSFSSEADVQRRNLHSNSVSKINDAARHFMVRFNVSVQGRVAAVLGPSTVSSYRVVDRRAQEPVVPPDNRPEHVKERMKRKAVPELTEFDLEIERRKKQCALLLGDMSIVSDDNEAIVSNEEPCSSFASVITKRSAPERSFASVIAEGHRTPTRTTPTRSFKSPLLALQASMYSPFIASSSSDEELFCDALRKELEPRGCLRADASNDELIAIQALKNMMPISSSSFGVS